MANKLSGCFDYFSLTVSVLAKKLTDEVTIKTEEDRGDNLLIQENISRRCIRILKNENRQYFAN